MSVAGKPETPGGDPAQVLRGVPQRVGEPRVVERRTRQADDAGGQGRAVRRDRARIWFGQAGIGEWPPLSRCDQ